MGISGGGNFYHTVKGIELYDLMTISKKISGSQNPSIYIDCNWVAHFVGRTRGDYIQKTVDIFHILARVGFLVYPIVDGDIRHHSKQISVGS